MRNYAIKRIGLFIPTALILTIIVFIVLRLIPGMGRILIEAVFQQDYPMIQAVVMITGTGILTLNLLVDLLYGMLDPRIRYS